MLFPEKPIHIREHLDDCLILFITFTTYPSMLPSMDSILSMNTVHWRLAVVLLEQVADPSPLLGRAYSDEVLDELRRGAGEERLPSTVYLSLCQFSSETRHPLVARDGLVGPRRQHPLN
jgi:hypothetical protein